MVRDLDKYLNDQGDAFIECVIGHYRPVNKYTAQFSRIACSMRRSPWWSTVPVYEQPEPVSGEINA